QGQQMKDPLGEERHSINERLIHRYPDRVLFLVTDMCSVYCRYCTRKRFTGKLDSFVKSKPYQDALSYIEKNKGIREVILSGGDPLTLSNSRLEKVLSDLRRIKHIEIIRVGTRMPVVCPMRIDQELVEMMKKYHPIFVMTHFNHPQELSLEAALALTKLVDHGFPVMNQMVLLNGINNHEALVQALSRRLLSLRVKPYYMFHCDPSQGTEHFQTSIQDSLEIQKKLWGKLSGLALPNLSLDIPGGGGKVGLVPSFELERKSSHSKFKGWDGFEAAYINPDPGEIRKPLVQEEFLSEWETLNSQTYGKMLDSSDEAQSSLKERVPN
ncbi:MAG: KamA family radical SAM protein, partial [Bdellovibrionales bacterium]|nr:KamA family radical SAM protein [Bdellovibrionales bacterium]